MELHVLGNGCPQPLPDWYGSAFVLQVGEAFLLVDCGPATTYKMTRLGIHTTCIEHLFLTHLSPGLTKNRSRDQTLARVARAFAGEVLLPSEMQTVDL